MSDDNADLESAEGVEEGLEIEQPDDDATQTDSTTDSPLYSVKVGGQEVEVELDELISGYQRQRDYTQKTQELAAERQRLEAASTLWEAIEQDPRSVIEALQEHYADLLNEEPPDPRDQRLQEVESFVEEQRQAEVERQVMSEIQRLQGEYGEFNGDELLEYAIDHQIPNLEAAFLHRQRAQERTQRDRDRQANKRAAPPVSGGSRAAGAHSVSEEPIESVRDAIKAALAEHGASSLLT